MLVNFIIVLTATNQHKIQDKYVKTNVKQQMIQSDINPLRLIGKHIHCLVFVTKSEWAPTCTFTRFGHMQMQKAQLHTNVLLLRNYIANNLHFLFTPRKTLYQRSGFE